MDKREIDRVKKLQRELVNIQKQLNDALVKAASTGRKLSLDDLEISVARLSAQLGTRRPISASRQPITASRRPLKS
jgi:hypothetical protein